MSLNVTYIYILLSKIKIDILKSIFYTKKTIKEKNVKLYIYKESTRVLTWNFCR